MEYTPVDDDIAAGLGEEITNSGDGGKAETKAEASSSSSDYDTFVPIRDRNTTRIHSILPSSAFLAPKKPPQSHTSILIGSSTSPNAFNSSFDNISSDGDFSRGDPVPMDYTGKERGRFSNVNGQMPDTESAPVRPGSSSSFDGKEARNRSKSSTRLDQRTGDSYHLGDIRGKPSQDLLLSRPEQMQTKATSSKRDSSHWNLKSVLSSRRNTIFTEKPEAGMKRIRRYKSHQGSNRFFLFGLIMTSDDNPFPFIASLVIMFALPILWFIFVAPFTWHHISPAPVIIFAYVWAVGASSMCVTAWRDPGVLPRDLDPDPPCTAGEDGNAVDITDRLALPLPRIIRIRNGIDLKTKWCDTCGIYRPPRCSHCRVCDNCVEIIDHHCTFLNTCIGRRNYFSFFAFLLASILACYMAIAFSILHIFYLTRPIDYALPGGGYGQGKNFGQALSSTPLSAVIFILAVMVMIPLMTLFAYHLRLICMNRTTVEQIRIAATSTYSEKPTYEDIDAADSNSRNPFSRKIGIPGRDANPFANQSILRNIKTVLLRPMTSHSWIDRYHYHQVDQRRINPAFTTSSSTA